jgi:hypothetical protein
VNARFHLLTILAIAVFCFSKSIQAQVFNDPRLITQALEEQRIGLLKDRKVHLGFNVGMAVVLGKHNLSEVRFNVSAGVSRAFGGPTEYANLLGSYQLQLECFRGGVGSSLLGTERAKFIWDLRNVIQVHGGWVANNPVKGRPLNKLLGQSESAIRDPFDYSITLGTVFVNGLNHKRNQQLGFLGLGILEFAGCYANDGPIFHTIGLGDGYDRWWTGAGFAGLYFQNDKGFVTDVSVQYLRYTGWQPNLYEMSNLLGIDYLSYKSKKEEFLNQGAYIWTVGIRNTVQLYGKFYENKKMDVQNLLHIGNSYTFHPNVLNKRQTFGAGLLMNGFTPITF